MKARSRLFALTLLTVPLWVACATTDHDTAAGSGGKSAMTDDPQAMWAEYEKLGTPGEHHKKLEPMVGRFKTTTRMWMDPSQPPEESTGSSDNKWILGNRFVRSEYKGQMMGKLFDGIGLMGYDNAKKCYVSTWCDSMSTSIMPVSEGRMDSSGKVMTTTVTMDDPVTGKPSTMRQVTTIKNSDEHRFEMWATGPDGKEFKTLEIVYTRM